MKPTICAISGLAVLGGSFLVLGHPPTPAPAPPVDPEVLKLEFVVPENSKITGLNINKIVDDGAVFHLTKAPHKVAVADARIVEVEKEESWLGLPDFDFPEIKMHGRAMVVGPDGVARELRFGEGGKKKGGIGAARLEMRLVPDMEKIEGLIDELGDVLDEKGLDEALLDTLGAALENIDGFAAAQILGSVIGPEGEKHEFQLGNAADVKPKKLEKNIQRNGGAALEFGVAPGQDILEFLNDALGGLNDLGILPDDLQLLPAPGAAKLLEKGAESPAAGDLIGKALGDPDAMKLLSGAMKDPALMKMLEQSLSDPAMLQLANQAFDNGTANALLSQLLGSQPEAPRLEEAPPAATEAANEKFQPSSLAVPADPTAALPKLGVRPSSRQAPSSSDPSPDAEIRELRSELKEQRALLEKVLKQLEKK